MATLSQQQYDPQGYAIPWVDDDECIECGLDDADYGPAESWPEWTDRWTFEEGPAKEGCLNLDNLPSDEPEPLDALEPFEPFEPSEDDELDYREWAAEIDRRWRAERIEHDGPVSDRDIMVLQGGAG
jgi:hypothetical protein